MPLALFDLDDTLIDGDCATLWGRYMTELGWVEKTAFLHQERRLMELYAEGRLAMEDYMDFSLAPIAGRTPAEIAGAVEDFVARIIAPRIHADALRCLERHRQAGDRLLIISASAHFLVSAIGRRLGVDEVLAIDIEERDGLYTGRTRGTLTYREGKVRRLDAWLAQEGETLAGATFYSDSRNDLPLLSRVDRPHTVNPDPALLGHAREAGWPQAQWWKVYADPQLDAWIEKALDGNPGLAVAHARVRQAKSMAGLVESIESPQIEGKGSLVRHRWPDDYFYGPGDLARTTSWNNSTEIGLNYKLDLWGRDRSDSERAVDLAHMAAAEARQAQLELEGNIVRAYVQLSLQYAEMDIAKAMLQQQRDILALAQRRLRGGIGTHFEVSQAEVPLPETERRIEVIDEEIQLTRNLLAALAGKGPGEGRTIRRPSLNLAAQPSLPSALPAELLGRRPDVVAHRWQVAALAKGVDVARADFYPNVDLMASVGFSAVGGGMLEFFRSAKYTYSAGPAVTLPIFDGGRLRSQLGEAAAGYDAAVEQYNQTLVDALKNISDQLIRLHSVDIQKDFAAQSVASAQKTYDIATLAYQRGLTDYLNVLNAQTRLFQQQLVQEQVQAARLAAHASLLTALGGGVGAGADTPAQRKLAPENVPVRAVSSR
ncbi:efflux transporter outer membrane subunit [Pseudomonas aeruginosa]|nr:efflux transporter outer membrane subunit [Pseudomonas aeruginosa]